MGEDEDFLAQAALRSLLGVVAVLRSCECEALLPAAEETGVARVQRGAVPDGAAGGATARVVGGRAPAL